MDFSNKVVLVTGASRGIGAAIAKAFAAEGAVVAVNFLQNTRAAAATIAECQDLGGEASAFQADVTDGDAIRALVGEVAEAFGKIDILVNNAAIRPHKPFLEVTLEDWESVRGVVLDGAFYTTSAIMPSMVKNEYGRVIFFTGDGAFQGPAERAHVSAAKMGLVGMCRSLATEFAPKNIRVNVVSPGSIDTSREHPEWYPNARPPDASHIPMQRQGKVDEIAGTVMFLVSDEGGFITGQSIHANGGTAFF